MKRQSKEEQFGASDGSNKKCSKIKLPTIFYYVSVVSCFPLEDYAPLTSRQTRCPSFAVVSCDFAFLGLLPLTFRQTPERVLRTVIENNSNVRDSAERGRELFHFKRGSSVLRTLGSATPSPADVAEEAL